MDDLRHWFVRETGWSDAILPDYAGGSIGSLPASILAAFGAPSAPSLLPALRPDILDPRLLADARVLVLIVVDGLSLDALQRERLEGLPEHAAALTSVFPSTTVAALTSLHLGMAPSRHGLAGYTLFLPSQRRVVNMVHFKPVDGGAFNHPPPAPERIVGAPTIFTRLACHGIGSVVVSHREYAGSPLTRVHAGATAYHGHRTVVEFAELLRRAAETPERRFVLGYWAGLDMIGHTWGPDSPVAGAELRMLARALVEGFLEPLRAGRGDVVVLLTSDHGHVTIDPACSTSIAPAVGSAGGLRRAPTGERRALGLALRHPEHRDLLRADIGCRGAVVDVADALRAGLYGPGPVHPEVHERIGNTLLLARGGATFPHAHAVEKAPTHGAHGSLTEREMVVPLLFERIG